MLIRHSLLYALGRGLPGLVNLLAIAVYTRLLAPEAYGAYALTIAGSGFVSAVLFQWLRLGLLRFLPAEPERQGALLSTVRAGFWAMAGLSAAAALAGLALAPAGLLRRMVVLGAALAVAEAWFHINQELARIQVRPARYGVLTLLRALLALPLGVGLIALGLGAEGPLLGLIAASLAASFVVMRGGWREAAQGGADRALARRLLRYGLPLSASSILAYVVVAADRFLIGWLIDRGATGAYAAAFDLAWVALTGLAGIVNLAAFPLAVRALEEGGVGPARTQLRDNLLLLLTIALPAACGLALTAPALAGVVLGEAFRAPAERIIPVAALAALLNAVQAYHLDLAFQLGRNTLPQLWIMLSAGLANVALNLLWIPPFGPVGAAFASAAAWGLACLLSGLWGRRHFPLPGPPARETAKLAVATLAMAAVVWPLRGHGGAFGLALQVAAGVFSFALLALAFDLAGVRAWLAGRVRALPAPPSDRAR